MNTLAIVILSLFLGIFIASLIALVGALLYQQHKLKLTIAALELSLPALIRDATEKLADQCLALTEKVSLIHGDELERFAKMGMQAANLTTVSAQRIEKASVLLGELCTHLLSEDALQSAGIGGGSGGGMTRTKLGPEEYAPDDGERYITTSRTVQQDDQLLLRNQPGDKPSVHPHSRLQSIPNIYDTLAYDGSESLAEAVGGENEE